MHDCGKDVKRDFKLEKFRNKFIEMITKFEFMWDCHQSHTSATKPCIELKLNNTTPVHCTPCRPGPREREFKDMGFDKMLKMGVLEPDGMERAL